MPPLACPACGGADDLTGVDDPDGKLVVCGGCGHRWRRDVTPTCRVCGSRDLEAVPTATLEEAGRGNMRTPSGIRDAYRCFACGARDATSSNPLPAEPGWRDRRIRPGVRRRDDAPPPVDRLDTMLGTFEVGAVVGGRWRISRLIRRTASGTLWRAGDDAGREVTFKLVRTSEAEAPVHAAAARAVGGLAHPSLLRVLDVKQRGGDVLVVAEAVDAPDLGTAAPLPAPTVRRLGAGVADALAALHAAGTAHLDVRPGTVLVPTEGPARLVDLGGGRIRARTGRDPRADDRLEWLAPERILAGDDGPAADVYGLGLALWVAAGGDRAALGATPAARAQARLAGDLPALDLAGTEGAVVADAVAAATRRRARDRPTAAELAELLAGTGGQPARPRRT